MGRRFAAALVAGATAGLASSSLAQSAAPAAPDPAAGPAKVASGMREQWRAMAPEDRQRFKSNVERWLAMPPEARHELRLQEGIRRERLQREADAALRDAGLQLEAERRAQFEQRYMEERRRIDRALRQEVRERRRRELVPVIEQLKKEFAPAQSSSSATPKK